MNKSRRRTRTSLVVAAAILLGGVGGCQQSDGDPALILDALAEANSIADAEYAAQTIAESMPNQTFVASNGQRFRGSESVVLGTVSEVKLASSHSVVDESVVNLPLGSPDAMWSMATVDLAVEEVWGDLAGERVVQFALPIRGGKVEEQLASIRALGRIVVFLNDGRVARNEELLGVVSGDGRVSFPVVAEDGTRAVDPFFEGIDTMAELRAALTQRARPEIRLDEHGARIGG